MNKHNELTRIAKLRHTIINTLHNIIYFGLIAAVIFMGLHFITQS